MRLALNIGSKKTVTFGGIHVAPSNYDPDECTTDIEPHNNKGGNFAPRKYPVWQNEQKKKRKRKRKESRERKRVLSNNKRNHQVMLGEETTTELTEETIQGTQK